MNMILQIDFLKGLLSTTRKSCIWQDIHGILFTRCLLHVADVNTNGPNGVCSQSLPYLPLSGEKLQEREVLPEAKRGGIVC